MVLIAAVGFKSIVTATAMVQTMLAGIGYLAVEGLRLSRSNPKRRTLKHWVLEKFQEVGCLEPASQAQAGKVRGRADEPVVFADPRL